MYYHGKNSIINSITSDDVCTLFFKLVEISYWNVLHLYFNKPSSLNIDVSALLFLSQGRESFRTQYIERYQVILKETDIFKELLKILKYKSYLCCFLFDLVNAKQVS